MPLISMSRVNQVQVSYTYHVRIICYGRGYEVKVSGDITSFSMCTYHAVSGVPKNASAYRCVSYGISEWPVRVWEQLGIIHIS